MNIAHALQKIKEWDPEEMTPAHNREFKKFLDQFADELTDHLNYLATHTQEVEATE